MVDGCVLCMGGELFGVICSGVFGCGCFCVGGMLLGLSFGFV